LRGRAAQAQRYIALVIPNVDYERGKIS
jgi:hypothetical protein